MSEHTVRGGACTVNQPKVARVFRGGKRVKGDPVERFHSLTDKTSFMPADASLGPCWLWTAGTSRGGYGSFAWNGKTWTASRAAWVLFKGPIPAGMNVLHQCDNPRCVNPAHLFLRTLSDNTRDALAKGRASVWTREEAIAAARMSGKGLIGNKNAPTKLTDATAGESLKLLKKGRSQYDVARIMGVSRSTILALASGRTWKHLPRDA